MTSKARRAAILFSSVLLGACWSGAWARPAFAVAPACDTLIEGFERATLGAFSSTGDAPGWTAVTTAANTGTFSAFAPTGTAVSDQQMTLTNAIAVPDGIIGGFLEFRHRFQIEFGFDGGVLETSTDGGATWEDAADFIIGGGYDLEVPSASDNPLAGRKAWTGTNPNSPAFDIVHVDLQSFA